MSVCERERFWINHNLGPRLRARDTIFTTLWEQTILELTTFLPTETWTNDNDATDPMQKCYAEMWKTRELRIFISRERERKKESAIASSSPDIYVTYEYIYVLIFTLNDILEMRMLHAYGTEMICLSDCQMKNLRELTHTMEGRILT